MSKLLWVKGIGWNTPVSSIGWMYIVIVLLVIIEAIAVVKLWKLLHD